MDPNYSISYQTGSLSIMPVSLTISADNKSEVYGNAPPALTASYAGFVNGDTSGSLSTKPSCTSTANTSSPYSGVGSYTITCSGAVDPNYSISYQTGTLTITPALLTVTAGNNSSEYSDPSPAVTFTITGFVNADTSSVLIKQPTFSQERVSDHLLGRLLPQIAGSRMYPVCLRSPRSRRPSNTPEIRSGKPGRR